MLEPQLFVLLVRCLNRNAVLNGKSRIFTMDARLFSGFSVLTEMRRLTANHVFHDGCTPDTGLWRWQLILFRGRPWVPFLVITVVTNIARTVPETNERWKW